MTKVTDKVVAVKFLNIERSADARGFKFDLKLSTIRRLLNTEKCFFSGEILNDIEGDDNQRTFDRINNRQGYVEGNVVVCCSKLNKKKGDLTIAEIIMLYKGLKKKKLI